MKKQIKVLFLTAVLLLVTSLNIGAATSTQKESIPTETYTYWNNNGEKTLVSSRAMYYVSNIIDSTNLNDLTFKEIVDITNDGKDNIYILDANGITIIDKNGNYLKRISEFTENGEQFILSGAKGIFFDRYRNEIYIADTERQRIIINDDNGIVKRAVYLPKSDLISENFSYKPVKITVNRQGDMYVLSEGCFYGALLFDKNNEFKGFFGANTVTTSISDIFGNIWDLFFTSDEQRANSAKKTPYLFSDLYADKDGYVWTCTGIISKWKAQQGQIRCVSAKGKNILKVKSSGKALSSDSFDFADNELVSDGSLYYVQDFVGLEIDDEGYIYSLDKTYGKVFIYDQECNLLTVLGGGRGSGNQKGIFTNANALTVLDEYIFVVDNGKNNVTVFKRSEYGALVMRANTLTFEGDHDSARQIWEKVLKLDRNSQLAYKGLAAAAIIDKDYVAALEYSKAGYDRESYSTAFTFMRNEWLKKNFIWMLLFVIAWIAVFVFVRRQIKKGKIKFKISENIKIMFRAIFHPFESFNEIKFNQKGSVWFGIVLIAIYYITDVVGQIYCGFMHTAFDKNTFNSLLVLLGKVGIILLWVICNWAMCVAVSGKSKMRETFIVASCAVIPQIIYNVLRLALSHIVSIDEAGVITLIFVITLILSGIALIIGTMIINEFDFFKFLSTGLFTLLAMVVVVFFGFMLVILAQQFWNFIVTIFNEVWYR